MGQSRKIEVKELLCHSLGPLPWALATPEGFPRKTNKAALAAFLQKDIQSPGAVPQNAATVIDGMSLVQKLNVGGNQTTFGGVSTALFSMALHEGSQSRRIDIIFDTYRENSIKNTERSLRGEVQGIQVSNVTASQLVKQWRKFLSQLKNKARFLVDEWSTQQYRDRLQRQGKLLYVTCDDKCYKITVEST